MIAADEDDVLTAQSGMVRLDRLKVNVDVISIIDPRHGEVATIDQKVLFRDDPIHGVNDMIIHLFDRGVRPSVIFDDVVMA